MSAQSEAWPALPYAPWKPTCENLHLRSQIVGKIRLAQTPWLNHSWHVTFRLSARGLTSGVMPYESRFFQIDFDFLDHRVLIQVSDGAVRVLPLREQAIADFYTDLFAALSDIGIHVPIHLMPSEIPDAVPFDQDRQHSAYDGEAVQRFWRALLQVERVFERFRTGFIGKSSPVHFFWGSFDLAVTRFSGRRAPAHPGNVPNLPDSVAREAYSHEVCSAGFWPGGGGVDYPAFYCYAYPEPDGFRTARVAPAEAFYSDSLREFVLPYENVRAAPSPDDYLMSFLQSTYEAAANAAGWDRASLECPTGAPNVPRTHQVPGV